MSLLILFPRRPYVEVAGGTGAGSGRHRGYSSGGYRKFVEPIVSKARKPRRYALNRESLVKVETLKEAVKGLAKVETVEEIKTEYSLGSKEIIEGWQALLAPNSLETLTKALEALSPVTTEEAEVVAEIVTPELIIEEITEPVKIKALEFTDEELILATAIIRDKITPRPKLEFTDEELILAAFLMKTKRNKR